jgi:hypothetical protein
VFNAHYIVDGAIVFKNACALGCEGIVSKRLGWPYRSGRSAHWLKIKNPAAPAVTPRGRGMEQLTPRCACPKGCQFLQGIYSTTQLAGSHR